VLRNVHCITDHSEYILYSMNDEQAQWSNGEVSRMAVDCKDASSNTHNFSTFLLVIFFNVL